MDKSSLMIGIFLFAAFMFPIFYVLIKQHSKERKHRNFLKKIATEHNLNLDKSESYGNLSLGLDTTAKQLLIVDFKEEADYDIIDLKEVGEIKILKKLLPGSYSRTKKEKIVHLSLSLENHKAAKITEITFYDEDDEDSTDADIRLNQAKQWDDLLHKNLAF